VSVFVLVFLLSLSALAAAEKGGELSGLDIMVGVDERPIPEDMRSEMSMDLINKRGETRHRGVRVFRQGDEKQIMWFLDPADVKGSSFLRIEHEDGSSDMWLYLPAFDKIRRIVASAKKENFMGSDFTYDDMSTRRIEDYTYRRLKDEAWGSFECYVVESLPKKGVNAEYTRVLSWVWKDSLIPVKEEYYDNLGELKKIRRLSEIEKIKGYWTAQIMTMEDVQKEHRTEIVFKDIEIDTGIDDGVFDTRYLKRIVE